MTDGEVSSPEPTDAECRRYYDANKTHFIVGQALHVRHILFAVTPGVNVHALSQRAESAGSPGSLGLACGATGGEPFT